MRRKPHVLAIVVGAAVVLLLSAPALGAAWLTTPEGTPLSGGTIQESPAIAINPAAPTAAAVVADEGGGAPVPHATTTSSNDWTANTWSAPAVLPHAGSAPAGQGDIAWGDGTKVYTVDVGNSSASQGSTLCNPTGGVFLWTSSNGGASYDPSPEQISQPTNLNQAIEPTVAFDSLNGRVYVAYTRLDYTQGGCGGFTGSRIQLGYEQAGGTITTLRTVSPFGLTARYRSPSIAILPDGRVIVAFRNDTATGSTVETEVCDLNLSTSHYCGPANGAPVGPSTVLGDATAPGAVSGLAGATTPSVVAAGGRVTVAWHALVGSTVRAFAAMSTDSGATFGPAQQIDPASPGNQVAPRLAADPQSGRVDVAYEWDAAGTGTVLATAVSAGRPLPGATTEAWAQPVVVEATGAAASSALPDQTALGHRLGIATARNISPLPATVVAFTDTSQNPGNQDVHVVGLLHGTTAPVIGAQTVTVSKNATTIVHLTASDPDGDPLTWSVGTQPTTAGSHVDAADAARGDFAFVAANRVGSDTFEAIARDGVNQASQTINVNVVNDPPEITCAALVTHEDTRLEVLVDSCVTDPNKDPVTVSLDSATGGTVERVSGKWYFNPAPKSTAPGSFVMHASDDGGLQATPRRVTVTIAANATPVTLVVTNAGKQRVLTRGAALRLSGHAVNAFGEIPTITWNFGDGTPTATGSAIAHRFRKAGSFIVIATAATAPAVKVRVLVHQPAVEMMGAPRVEDGVMQVRVRTRVAGKLKFRVDSRSQTISVPAGLHAQTLRMQVTSGPLVRLSLRLTPSKKTPLKALRMRQLVLVSPVSAG
jgi:PKD domain/Bacterial Ig domain